jgi:hypothetical protein
MSNGILYASGKNWLTAIDLKPAAGDGAGGRPLMAPGSMAVLLPSANWDWVAGQAVTSNEKNCLHDEFFAEI